VGDSEASAHVDVCTSDSPDLDQHSAPPHTAPARRPSGLVHAASLEEEITEESGGGGGGGLVDRAGREGSEGMLGQGELVLYSLIDEYGWPAETAGEGGDVTLWGGGDRFPPHAVTYNTSYARLPSPPLLPSYTLMSAMPGVDEELDGSELAEDGGGFADRGGHDGGEEACQIAGNGGVYCDEDMLLLVYDPILMCYYERTSGRYFQLKEGCILDDYSQLPDARPRG
jgi:hypothetical protein